MTRQPKDILGDKAAARSSAGYRGFFWIFFRMGCVAFGGWSTTVILIEKKLINELGLLNKKQLQNAIASGQILPGAAQVIVVVQSAYYMRGIRGAVIAAAAYLLPSLALTVGFSFIYFGLLGDSNFDSRTLGLQAAVGGIILGNAYRIGKSNINSSWLWIAAVPACLATLVLHIPTIYTIFFYALIGIFIGLRKRTLPNE